MFSLNPADYNSVADFIVALDSSITHKTKELATCMALGIEHEDLFQEILHEFLLRAEYEIEYEASSLTYAGSTVRITIPLTADMTFIFSDATEI